MFAGRAAQHGVVLRDDDLLEALEDRRPQRRTRLADERDAPPLTLTTRSVPRDAARFLQPRPLQLDGVVDDAVVRAVDDPVEIEVAVRVPTRTRELHPIIDRAVVGAVDRAV